MIHAFNFTKIIFQYLNRNIFLVAQKYVLYVDNSTAPPNGKNNPAKSVRTGSHPEELSIVATG
jgi:hypothetical protein